MVRSTHDLVIRNGLVVDGTGGAPFHADIAVDDGRIVAVGDCTKRGVEEIDAKGCIVTPGFVDVHTHYDGQLVWAKRLIPSSCHGVTTVLVGNCGVGFAPCKSTDHSMLINVMEGVEDIPEIVMTTGLDWSWETFPEYLDVVDSRPHDIDFAVYLPHSPLRVYAMRERGANREPATKADLARMTEIAAEALRAGAIGISSSNAPGHRTGTGEFIPSFRSAQEEHVALAGAMRKVGHGVYQLLADFRSGETPEQVAGRMAEISKVSGGLVTFTLAQFDSHPRLWNESLVAIEKANLEKGVSIKGQVYPRPIGVILGFNLTLNPFSLLPSYQPLLTMSEKERLAALRTPELRQRLLQEQPADPLNPLFKIGREFARLFPLRTPDYEPSGDNCVASLAARTGVDPAVMAYDLLLENEGNGMLLAVLTNYANNSLDDVLTMLKHPDTIVGLGDGGAHYGLVCDASFPTYMLTHWTRQRAGERIGLPQVVQSLTSQPAATMGFNDRGTLAPGKKADINVIDYDNLTLHLPEIVHDLPSGGRRIHQKATGYRATIVSGEIIARDDQPTDALPGRLIRASPGPVRGGARQTTTDAYAP